MPPFITKRALAIVGIALLIIAAIIAYRGLVDKQADVAKENQEVGRTIQREDDLQQTINRVEKANEVRSGVEAEAALGRGDRLYQQCLRSARPGTAANCERFLPERPAPVGSDPR